MGSLIETARAWRDYGPEFPPLPHPIWRNTARLRKTPLVREGTVAGSTAKGAGDGQPHPLTRTTRHSLWSAMNETSSSLIRSGWSSMAKWPQRGST